jgi:hypothetical protein
MHAPMMVLCTIRWPTLLIAVALPFHTLHHRPIAIRMDCNIDIDTDIALPFVGASWPEIRLWNQYLFIERSLQLK